MQETHNTGKPWHAEYLQDVWIFSCSSENQTMNINVQIENSTAYLHISPEPQFVEI